MSVAARAYRRSLQWSLSHQFAVDVAFAAVLGAFEVLGYVSADRVGSERPQDWIGALLLIAQTVAFAFRRTRPLPSMLAVVAGTVAFWVADYPTNFDAFSLLAIYAATAHSGADRRRVWLVVGGIVGLLTAIALAGVLSPSEDLPALAVLGIAAIHLTAAVAGEVVQDRRRRVRELEQRAVRAEAERELLTRQAVLDERARIARDLHDVVAHAMSVMVVQAGAARRVVDTRPDQAADALGHIQTTGREALTEMRRMVGVLRDDAPVELTPQPSMDDLQSIVQHCVAAGVPTSLTVVGDRPARAAGAEIAGYRVVQEALTNVIKHAGRPVQAAVKVTYTPGQMRLEVTDDGLGATTRDVERATGHGLIGMRERVELYCGSLRVGPRPGGGFRVAATIPLEQAVG